VSKLADHIEADLVEAASAASKPLRVCHVAYTFYETDNRVIRYAREMASHGHEVDVIALRRPGQTMVEPLDGVRLIRIQRRSITERSAATYLAKLIWFFVKAGTVLTALHLRRRYDLVHVHNVPDFLVFTALLPKLTGARIILDIHDLLPELYAGKFGGAEESTAFKMLLKVERASCAFADHVIVGNDLWLDRVQRRSATHSTSMLNYPDTSVFRPNGHGSGHGEGPFIFLYPGSLNHHQGVDLAVKAFTSASKVMPHSELHIYGDGPARPLLTDMARDSGLADRVKIRDRVPLAAMAGIIADADVGLVPKRADGFGNEAFSTKILEFMASKVPVIVSRTRVDQHHFDSSLVRFFDSGDDGQLAEAMIDCYQNRADAAARAEAGFAFAQRNSWQQRGGDYRKLITSLLAPSSSRQRAVRQH
jgi:glycosyltransferase involved in cell wall biosynthesis